MDENFEDKFRTLSYPAVDRPEGADALGSAGKTVPYPEMLPPDEDLTTRPYQSEVRKVQRTEAHQIGVGDIIELNSLKYEILEILSEEGKTAEAVIYKVKDKKNRVFALKLYYEFKDQHLEPGSDTLQRIRELDANGLLFLFDFGTGPNKYLDKYCFEISGFAQGGDLLTVDEFTEKYTPGFIEKTVIPYIHNGLRALHGERIFHCDLKPQNVFFLDEAQTHIVVGDYGSAKSFDKSSEKELSYTTLTKGTEFYLAPEQAFGIVSEKNDYYSLGMIILHLLYPAEVTRQNLRKIFERRTRGLPIIDFDEKFGRLNRLIEGLTLQDYNNRWGSGELDDWLSGKDVPVNYGVSGRSVYLEVGGVQIRTAKEIADYIRKEDGFFDVLIDDREGYGMLLSWVKTLQGDQGMKLFDSMISHYKQFFGVGYVRDAMLFYFDPAHPVTVGSATFDFSDPKHLDDRIKSYFNELDSLWKITDFKTIQRYFFRLEYTLRRLRTKSGSETVAAVDGILGYIAGVTGAGHNTDFAELKAECYIHLQRQHLPDLFHHFDADRGFRDLRGNSYHTLFEVSEFLKSNPVKAGDDHILQHEKAAFIKSRSGEEFVEFVEFGDDVSEFLFEHDTDFELLPSLIVRFSLTDYSLKFISNALRYYRNDEPWVQREVLLRLIDPELPVNVDGTEIYLFNLGDFHNKLEEFMAAFENLRFGNPLEVSRKVFFGFEFCLMQVALNDRLTGKSLVEPVFQKLHGAVNANLPDWPNLRAAFYRTLNEQNLIAIMHQFNPSRAFCAHNGDFLDRAEDLALYYLKYPEQYNTERSVLEREAFFRKIRYRGLSGLGLEEFVMRVFRSKTTFNAIVRDIRFDENETNEVTFYYDYEISLGDFLASEHISTKFAYKNPVVQRIVLKKKTLSTKEELFELFTAALKKRHAFGLLADATYQSFSEAMKSTRHDEFLGSIQLIPRYMLYMLPVFGLLLLSAAYLTDYSLFKQISFELAPSLQMVAARIAPVSASSLLFAAYFLNLAVAVLLLLPLLSLKRSKSRFARFNRDYGIMISRMTLILVFAPVVFVGVYRMLEPLAAPRLQSGPEMLFGLPVINFTILLYIGFMLFQVLFVISAFFRVSIKIRLWPLAISLLIYLTAGYLTIFQYNLI